MMKVYHHTMYQDRRGSTARVGYYLIYIIYYPDMLLRKYYATYITNR